MWNDTGAPRARGYEAPPCRRPAWRPPAHPDARVALHTENDGGASESWPAQERAAAEKVGGNVFYLAALQVHCCVKSSHRLIVEFGRQLLQGCLDLRKSL